MKRERVSKSFIEREEERISKSFLGRERKRVSNSFVFWRKREREFVVL